jgi:two-component system sensor histidine kinase BaeS
MPGFDFPLNGLLPNPRPRRDPPRDRPPRARPPDFDRDPPLERPPGIEHRLALFDRDRQPLIGRADSIEGHTLQEITVDGKTVGWLGLRNERRPSDPLGIAFLKQQAQAVYLVGAIALALAGLMALLLARHLHSPLRQLIEGTRSLASRRFDTRISVTSSDELGELARDFNRMARTLEQYEQLRRQWISDIAHELRTPIAVLQGEIEALQDGIRPAGPGQIASLHAEVVHIGRIVQSLHDLSLAESDALNLRKEPLDIVTVLRACLGTFQVRFAERRIEIADELGDAGAAAMVAGDADRLTQVFSNLLENTLRYTDPPGRLSVGRLSTVRDAVLYFADTPPGVPAE